MLGTCFGMVQSAIVGTTHSGVNMANVKQGNLTKSPQWWRHLKDWKRVFWKSERKAQNKDIKERLNDGS